jgi:hypothetical protein
LALFSRSPEAYSREIVITPHPQKSDLNEHGKFETD